MKILTDEAFEKYEKSEELVSFIKKEYPYYTEEEATILAKAIAAKRVEDIKIDLMKEKKDKPFHGYNKEKHSTKGGLSEKARKKYNRENNANLKAPVSSKEAKKSPKKAARRRSFCARMSGVKGPTSKDGKLTPKGAALKRWDC